MNRWRSLVVPVVLLVLVVVPAVLTGVGQAGECPREGQTMPELTLTMPEDPELRSYLGLEGGKSFRLSDVKAEILVVEIFSMYCPYCQREAPNVNRLYELIGKDPEAAERIRLLGVGASNSDYEVKVFQNQYLIKFPLIPDPKLSVHDLVGAVRTPHFFVLKRTPDGARQVIYSESGSFGRPEAFLRTILEKAGPPAAQP